jgi:hypothetical protein
MAARKVGAPTMYNHELALEICSQLSNSHKPLSKLMKDNPHWPCAKVIYDWRLRHKEFSEMYNKAKCSQIDCLTDRALELAQTPVEFYETENGTVPNSVANNRNRLEIDTIKWFACKLAPKIYGDKIQQDITVKTHEESIKDLK